MVGELVWYVTGRFYKQGDTLQDVGYFLYLQGVEPPHGYFTFSSEPFTSSTVMNGPLGVGIDHRGTFSIYLRDEPGATFEEPLSFSIGRCIATFARTSIVATTEVAETAPAVGFLANVFSARLVSSEPFDFGGRRYDFAELVGKGVTQWGVAATEPLAPPQGYDAVVPFVGSAIRFG
ncbi:MAG TPA: hypothetical protein VGR02_00815 [Thermoanaerobaculia bacterium]|nr:hypothetical protein [Thermoanaerobaculia bacterium]